ncbi:MAG TPA: type IV secretory system conjugative DNA transfer family protein [Acidimicrobiales bacterium]|nr:type IV secretory system conjugative DNA transfer family protein [Acidimicrobiales bacterium]
MSEKIFPESPNSAAGGTFALLSALQNRSAGVYLGHDSHGCWYFAAPQHSVMVLGPPRSGKTASIVVPNVLAATGPVVSTSTKPDVLEATVGVRSQVGRCLVFDPTGTMAGRAGLPDLRWSPLQSSTTWLGALTAARSLVATGSPGHTGGGSRADHTHWTERAEALLAPLLFAAALDGGDMHTVLTWVDRRLALPAQQVLAAEPGPGTQLARNLLDGIVSTDPRELSGIWSTASGSLGGFRSHEALLATTDPTFDADQFVRSSDTLYVAAPAHQQSLVAPMVVGLLEDVRRSAYARSSAPDGGLHPRTVLLALDELANIAPLPELPAMISEGGGQGVTTIACFQDLSQARRRWPVHADGFPSLFGTTVVLPGIGDVRTLDALSQLAGDMEVPTRTVSAGRSLGDRPLVDLVTGGRPHVSESYSTLWRRRLPVDVIAQGAAGHAVAFDERNRPTWLPLAPSHSTEPWRSLRGVGRDRSLRAVADRSALARTELSNRDLTHDRGR